VVDQPNETPDRNAPHGAAASTLTPGEQAVRFVNSEVLDPPSQGSISFTKPYAEQVAVMAFEDGRSFLQGLEQILLVAIAKGLEKLLSGGGGAAASGPSQHNAVSQPNVSQALQAAERMLTVLPQFHATLAETVTRVRVNNG
jgi:hypothetical protein